MQPTFDNKPKTIGWRSADALEGQHYWKQRPGNTLAISRCFLQHMPERLQYDDHKPICQRCLILLQEEELINPPKYLPK